MVFGAVRHTGVAMVHICPLWQVFCHTDRSSPEEVVADTWMNVHLCQVDHTAKVVVVGVPSSPHGRIAKAAHNHGGLWEV